jgi:hypothetical protein
MDGVPSLDLNQLREYRAHLDFMDLTAELVRVRRDPGDRAGVHR